MVHAICIYASKNKNNNPMSASLQRRHWCCWGAQLKWLSRIKNPRSERKNVAWTGQAGMAFENSPVAAVHAWLILLGGVFI